MKKMEVEALNIHADDPLVWSRLATRNIVVLTVYSIWNQEKRPMTHAEIVESVITQIKKRVKDETWKKAWKLPSERDVGRRIQEALVGTHYLDKIARLTEVKSRVYQPNMERFK